MASTAIDPESIPERATVGVLFRQFAKYGDRPLVHFRDGNGPWQVFTWEDMRRHVLAVASGLIDAGVKAGDCVLLMSENRIEWIYCDYAIQSIGAITVPVYPNVSQEAVRTIANNSAATFGIASDAGIAAKLAPTRTVTMDGELAQWVEAEPKHIDEIARRLAAISPDHMCTIIYTSGTTGEPKGVELAHRNLVDIIRAAAAVHPITERDTSISWLPYAHSYGRINDVFLCLYLGMEAWISRGPDHLAEEIADVKPTVMNSVPRVYEKMYAAVMARVHSLSSTRRSIFKWALGVGTRFSRAEHPGAVLRAQRRLADRLVLKNLRNTLTGGNLRFFVSGGAGLAREIEEFFWALGVPILNGWGLTETSAGACSNTLHAHRFLTVGRPFPGVELKIAPDGEIMVKGPGNMLAYHKQPEATEEVLKDGWFYTGDIGEIDADGFLRITDRKKSLFKTAGGKYIAPLQIEHELLSDPLIARAVVVGEGKPYVTALIVPDWDAAKAQGVDVEQRVQHLVDRVNGGLGHWETIKYFTLLQHDFTEDSGELSLKLDVKRKVVAEHYSDEIEAMYAGKSKDS
ncbi:MAG TPA: long-chain fatty acid--CoA ligase [Candidatus Dormibacteraeota bacterium]|nr:long-chain fatty acid--CoA ligase [Candidatus Dormibacteraeota bacterium]